MTETAPPERIWTVGGNDGHFFLSKRNFATVEYVRASAQRATVDNLRDALQAYIKFSDEAALLLDQDKDSKCLKLLLAMAGRAPKYRADVDAALATAAEKELSND